MLATPDVTIKSNKIKFPSIHKAKIDHNSSFVLSTSKTNDLNYKIDFEARKKINQKRLNRYMCSEERFRKTKQMVFGNDSIFDFDSKPIVGKYNSPLRKLGYP